MSGWSCYALSQGFTIGTNYRGYIGKMDRKREMAHEKAITAWERARERKSAKKKKRKQKKLRDIVRIPAFYSSPEWVAVRYQMLTRDGAICACCGRSPKDGAIMNVDHIIARSKAPELSLDPANMQVLCATCNEGKGWRDSTNWRTIMTEERADLLERQLKPPE